MATKTSRRQIAKATKWRCQLTKALYALRANPMGTGANARRLSEKNLELLFLLGNSLFTCMADPVTMPRRLDWKQFPEECQGLDGNLIS